MTTIPNVKTGRSNPNNRCKIAGIYFYISPQSYQETKERLYNDVPTLDGYVRFDFGTKPAMYTLTGTTGNAGFESFRQAKLENYFPNQPDSRKPPQVVSFEWPDIFKGKKMVIINSYQRTVGPNDKFYTYYTLSLEEYSTATSQSYIKQASTSAAPVSVGAVPMRLIN